MANWDDVSSPVNQTAGDWDSVSSPVNQDMTTAQPIGASSDAIPQAMKDASLSAVYNPDTAPLARAVAYGANAISGIPGLKELGSAIAATPQLINGADAYKNEYNRLEDAQAAMREAGAIVNPDMTNLAKASGTIEGLGLGSGLASAITPASIAGRFAAFAENHPYLANMAVAAPANAVYGFANGNSLDDRGANAATSAAVGAASSLPLTYAARNWISPALETVGSQLSKYYEGSPLQSAVNAIGDKADTLLGNNVNVPVTSERGLDLLTGSNSNLPSFTNTPSSQQMRSAASNLYKQASDQGGVLTPQFTNDFISKVEDMQPQTSAGKILRGDNALTQLNSQLQQLKDQPLTLHAAQEVDEALGDMVDKYSDPLTGKLTKEGKQIYDVQTTFRNMINNADQNQIVGGNQGFRSLSDARQAWSTARKLADIERIQNRAALTDQPATGVKSGLRTLISNPARFNSFNPQEQEAIRKAAQTGIATDALRLVGSRLVPIAAGAAGEAVGGHLGASAIGGAAYGISSGARNMATKIQMNKVNALRNVIAQQYLQPSQPFIPAYAGSFGSVPATQNILQQFYDQ